MSFVVDPEGLLAHGRVVERTAAGVAADLARLRAGIAAAGAAPFGSAVAVDAAYRELTSLTGEALELVRAVTARSGSGVSGMADAYVRADAAAEVGLGST